MKLQKICLVLTTSLASVIVASGMAPAQAALINFDFSSTSSSGVRGRISFDDSVTKPGRVQGKPSVANYLGAIRSYNITNGRRSFSGAGTFIYDQINVYNNIIDVYDPINRTWAGDGLEFQIFDQSIDQSTHLSLRLLYPDTTVLKSLSLSDISLQNAIASSAPELASPPSSSLFTLLFAENSGKIVIEDGTYFGSDFATNAAPVSEPSSMLISISGLLALGSLGRYSASKRKKQQQKSAEKQTV
ncbi:MAG: hypothetical protein ACIWVG_18735 [Gloeotrichia echinulata HAB0833]